MPVWCGVPPHSVVGRSDAEPATWGRMLGAMRFRGSDERHPMAGSGRMLLSTLVLGIVFTGGIAVLPIAETTSAPVVGYLPGSGSR